MSPRWNNRGRENLTVSPLLLLLIINEPQSSVVPWHLKYLAGSSSRKVLQTKTNDSDGQTSLLEELRTWLSLVPGKKALIRNMQLNTLGSDNMHFSFGKKNRRPSCIAFKRMKAVCEVLPQIRPTILTISRAKTSWGQIYVQFSDSAEDVIKIKQALYSCNVRGIPHKRDWWGPYQRLISLKRGYE